MSEVNACIIAGDMCKWGLREAGYLDLAQETAKACLDDIPGLKPKDFDGLLFASTFVGRRSCPRKLKSALRSSVPAAPRN